MLYDFILFGGKVRGNGLKLESAKCKLYHNKLIQYKKRTGINGRCCSLLHGS
jgi:hypothetical protein